MEDEQLSVAQWLEQALFGYSLMSDRDAMVLKAYQWREKYNNFPSFRFSVHIVLVLLVTLQAFFMTVQFIPYSRSCEHTFYAVFSPQDAAMYNMQDVLHYINDVVDSYYSFPLAAVEKYGHTYTDEGVIDPVSMKVTTYTNLTGSFWTSHAGDGDDDTTADDSDISGDFNKVSTKYHLDLEDPLGPFEGLDGPELQQLFFTVAEIRLKFTYKGVNIQGPIAVMGFYWDITLTLTQNGGEMHWQFRVEARAINTEGFDGGDTFTILSVLILLTSLLSMVISITHLFINHRMMKRTRDSYVSWLTSMSMESDNYPKWRNMPLAVKLSFFSYWAMYNILATVAILSASCIGLARDFGHASNSVYLVCFGFGSLLVCGNLLRYLEYFADFFLHLQTLRNAFGHIARFCLSVFPLFWAFLLFAVVSFGPYLDEFRDIQRSAMTLFGLLNSDDILQTFGNIESSSFPYPVVELAFIYGFVIIFVTSVLNVFIIIIEDAYHDAHEARIRREQAERDRDGRHVNNHKLSARERLDLIFNTLSMSRYNTSTHVDVPLVNIASDAAAARDLPRSPALYPESAYDHLTVRSPCSPRARRRSIVAQQNLFLQREEQLEQAKRDSLLLLSDSGSDGESESSEDMSSYGFMAMQPEYAALGVGEAGTKHSKPSHHKKVKLPVLRVDLVNTSSAEQQDIELDDTDESVAVALREAVAEMEASVASHRRAIDEHTAALARVQRRLARVNSALHTYTSQ